MNKRDIILNSIIKEYLKSQLPVSSNELKMKLELNMAASTIRVYFKQLSDEGSITKLHMSGGRIPTQETLKSYWRKKLSPNRRMKFYNTDRIKEAIREHNIYCMIRFYEKSYLKEVINADERYLVLVFGTGEIALKYNKKIEMFLKSFIEYEINDIYKIASQVGLTELAWKLKTVLIDQNTLKEGYMFLLETGKELANDEFYNYYTDPLIFDELNHQLYFEKIVPEGLMALNQKAQIEEKKANIFCIGHLQNDFESFFDQITIKE